MPNPTFSWSAEPPALRVVGGEPRYLTAVAYTVEGSGTRRRFHLIHDTPAPIVRAMLELAVEQHHASYTPNRRPGVNGG